MLQTLFVILVVVGFILWFLATLPNVSPYTERGARFCFMLAALIWAVGAWKA
jgi:hypothetical protein